MPRVPGADIEDAYGSTLSRAKPSTFRDRNGPFTPRDDDILAFEKSASPAERDIMEGIKTAGILDWFRQRPSEAKPTPEVDYKPRAIKQDPPSKDYPSIPELETSKGFEQFYGSEHARYFEPGKARQRVTTFDEIKRTQGITGARDVSEPVNWEIADRLHAAWLASERSAVSKLGFSPSKTVESYDPKRKLTVSGLYSRMEDKIWYDAANPDALVHESLHRGIHKMRQEGKLPQELVDVGKKVGNYEEFLVRAMMVRHFGDIEMGGGELGDQQIKDAKRMVSEKHLDLLEKAAADYIAEKRPGGPR